MSVRGAFGENLFFARFLACQDGGAAPRHQPTLTQTRRRRLEDSGSPRISELPLWAADWPAHLGSGALAASPYSLCHLRFARDVWCVRPPRSVPGWFLSAGLLQRGWTLDTAEVTARCLASKETLLLVSWRLG